MKATEIVHTHILEFKWLIVFGRQINVSRRLHAEVCDPKGVKVTVNGYIRQSDGLI